MKSLFVALTSLTLLLPLCSSGAKAQPQQGQYPGGSEYPSQSTNNANDTGGEAFPGDNRQPPSGGNPGMDRQANSDMDSGPAGGGNRPGGSAGNGPPGGGGGNFRGFGGGGGNSRGFGGGGQFQGQGGGPQQFAERRQRMMKRFDTNGDGVLDDNERAKMRAFMQQRRQERENRPNGGGDFPNGSPPPRQSEPQ